MFSNVGMNPYGPGGGIVTQQAQSATSPGADSRSAMRGETGAAAARAETVERVDPARQAAPSAPLPEKPPAPRSAEFGTRFVPIVTPQQALEGGAGASDADGPDAPAGPPPAFQRSLLEARLAQTSAPDPAPATISAPEPPAAVTPEPDAVRELTDPGPEATGRSGLEPADPGAVSAPSPSLPALADAPSAFATAADDADPLRAAIRRILADGDPVPVPPSAENRAEAEFAGLRRMDVPYDTATVDLSR